MGGWPGGTDEKKKKKRRARHRQNRSKSRSTKQPNVYWGWPSLCSTGRDRRPGKRDLDMPVKPTASETRSKQPRQMRIQFGPKGKPETPILQKASGPIDNSLLPRANIKRGVKAGKQLIEVQWPGVRATFFFSWKPTRAPNVGDKAQRKRRNRFAQRSHCGPAIIKPEKLEGGMTDKGGWGGPAA